MNTGHHAGSDTSRRDEFCDLWSEERTMGKQTALAVILAVFASASMAALPTFDEVDANGDGQITMKEASTHEGLMTTFDKADENRDGQLSKAEYEKLKSSS
jgi:hypothetical protein